MAEFWTNYGELLMKETASTLMMTFSSVLFCYLVGTPLGVLVYMTAPGSLTPYRGINTVLDWIINVVRSIPFLILMVALIPMARIILGKGYGPSVVVFAMVVGAAPFVARLVDGSLHELDPGVIESAKAMGATNFQIVTRVLLPESLPSLLRGMAVASITIMGYTAMAGAIGGGGLGDIAIRYGYHRRETPVMVVTIIIMIVFVQLIQLGFGLIVKKIDKSK